MKMLLTLAASAILCLTVSPASAQVAPGNAGAPPGGSDKNLAGDDIKMRSIELDRMKREAKIAEAAAYAPINTKVSDNFSLIKEDYEGIQLLGNTIIESFNKGVPANAAIIESSARQIAEKAKRLDSNLFDPVKDPANLPESVKESGPKPASVRDMIIKLDSSIGDFITSPLFQNLQVIDPEVAIKTRKDLLNIAQYGEMIAAELVKK